MSLPVRAAILLAATPLAAPVAMFYDLILSGMALAWLVRWSEGRRFPPGCALEPSQCMEVHC